MKFANSFSRDLGVFTWAELQAAYPNGGGALAALPVGVRAYVSDWNIDFVPNAAKTAWIPSGRITLFASASDSAGVLNTVTTFLENFTVAFPTDLLVPGNLVTATLRTNRTAGSVNYRPAIQVGATRLALATSSGLGAKFFGVAALMCRAANWLSGQADAAVAMGVGSYTGSSLTAATVNGSNPLRFGVDLFAAADSTTTVVYEYCVVQMSPGQ